MIVPLITLVAFSVILGVAIGAALKTAFGPNHESRRAARADFPHGSEIDYDSKGNLHVTPFHRQK